MTNITILGIGRLGLGLALLIEKVGYNVLGVDINEEYIKQLNNKWLILKNGLAFLLTSFLTQLRRLGRTRRTLSSTTLQTM